MWDPSRVGRGKNLGRKEKFILDEMEKDRRIKKEIRRLNTIYKGIGKNEKSHIDGLVKRTAYMRVTLEDMEEDLNENGFTELFSQSEKAEPYQRERPIARLYNTMNKNYQSIMKQLSEFIIRDPPAVKENEFDKFVQGREDV
jgi:hypothetical protein